MTRLLFGLLILLVTTFVATSVDPDTVFLPESQQILAISDPTLPDKPIVYVSSDPPLPSLPSNCYYLNLWSYYLRWTADGKPVKDQPPYAPVSSSDPPLVQHERYLFTPPENLSFATEDCGLTYGNPCIVPVGVVNDGFGKVPVGKMIRNTLSVDTVTSCSKEDIGHSNNYMTFLDPVLNDDLGIVQYHSSLASYAFRSLDKKTCNRQVIPSYPITGGTVSTIWITSNNVC